MGRWGGVGLGGGGVVWGRLGAQGWFEIRSELASGWLRVLG